jgi:AraC-like DNA-binding protein
LIEEERVDEAVSGRPKGHVELDVVEANRCSGLMHDLLERRAREPWLLAEVMAAITGLLVRPHPISAMAPSGAPEWLGHLMRDLQDPDRVAQPIGFWQRRSGVSPEHFSRTCRRFLGEPPTVLLNRARVELVKVRMRQGEDKVAAFALDAGFQNLGFFYRCFRRFAGCTPREWLARHAAGATVPR